MNDNLKNELKILLVEDSGIQAKAFVALFNSLGYQNVTACPNADAGFEQLRLAPWDLILCDWQMPKKSGLDFLKELRTHSEFKSIPFLFLTANGEKQFVIEALKSGAQDFILKPPTPEIIEQKISGLLTSGLIKLDGA